MVRKIIALAFCAVILLGFAHGSRANAYSVYDGNMSSTYVTYFKDILSGVDFTDNYVAFRSSNYEYIMVVGELTFENNTFSLTGDGTIYTFNTDGNYNSNYTYDVDTISNFTLTPNNRILYSDLGSYPQLVSRGDKYEMLTTVLLCTFMLSFVVYNFFRSR